MKQTIKTLIVEDDVTNITLLKLLLKKYSPEIEVIGEAINTTSFLDLLFKMKPDLLLLDIHLGEKKNTLDILSDVKNLDCEIIIISSHESFAVKAINQFNITGYIIKPVNKVELKNLINVAVQKITNKKAELISNNISEKIIAVSTSKSIEFIAIKDILYLEANGKNTIFHLIGGNTQKVSKNLGEYVKILPSQFFFRIHHKYVVNLQKVIRINKTNGYNCHLENGITLPIAKRRLESLRTFLQI